MDSSLLYKIKKLKITYNRHSYGILRDTFEQSQKLKDAYTVTGVSYDTEGKEYIAAMEHKKYPFNGTQYHP